MQVTKEPDTPGTRQVKAGAAKARQQKLGTAAVVGVTCCSAVLPALDGSAFEVVVLDEASQMVEPLSLLPLVRAGCRCDMFCDRQSVS